MTNTLAASPRLAHHEICAALASSVRPSDVTVTMNLSVPNPDDDDDDGARK